MKSLLTNLAILAVGIGILQSIPQLTKFSAFVDNGYYQQLISRAQDARKQNDWQAAETALRSACQVTGNNANRNANAEFALGELLSQSMRFGEAEKHFRIAYLKCRSLDLRERSLLALAQCDFAVGQYEQSAFYLNLLASSQNSVIRHSAEVIAGLNAYFAGNKKEGLRLLSISLDKRSSTANGEEDLRKYADCFARSSRPNDAAVILLKLLADEKKRNDFNSKDLNDLTSEAASALSQATGISTQFFVPMLSDCGVQSPALAQLKSNKVIEDRKIYSDAIDQKFEEELKLSIERYGPGSEENMFLFHRTISSIKSFTVQKRCVELMLKAIRPKYAECSDQVCDCEEELARAYIKAGEQEAGYKIYSAILAKCEPFQGTHESASKRCFALSLILGSYNLHHNNLQLAELHLAKAVVLSRKYPLNGQRQLTMEKYIDVLKKLGKSKQLKAAQAELEGVIESERRAENGQFEDLTLTNSP